MYINSAFGLFVVAVPLDCAVLAMSKMDKSARWVQSGLTRRGYRPVNFTSIPSREQSVIVAGTPAKGGNPHRSAFVTDAAGASPWARPTSSPRCIGSSRPAAIAGSRVPTPMPLSEGCVPATCGAEEVVILFVAELNAGEAGLRGSNEIDPGLRRAERSGFFEQRPRDVVGTRNGRGNRGQWKPYGEPYPAAGCIFLDPLHCGNSPLLRTIQHDCCCLAKMTFPGRLHTSSYWRSLLASSRKS